MQALEGENLRLIERCAELAGERDRSVAQLGAEIAAAERECAGLAQQTGGLAAVPLVDTRAQAIARDTDAVERDLGELTRVVERFYRGCFKKSADVTAVMMLTQMEMELERMYAVTAKLPQQYISEKQTAIDRLKREESRRKKQEAQELEQQRKIKAAFERSVQPIHQRMERPLNPRILPTSMARHSVDQRDQDEEIQDQMLFGMDLA
jgi:flagellar biosynthesis GTPase FlhF